MYFNFDDTYRVPLGWLSGIAKSGEYLLKDIRCQLQNCGLEVPSLFLTNNELKKLESYTIANRHHKSFGDRRSLLAEYRRVWKLMRHTFAETPVAALNLVKQIKQDKKSNAAARLREKPGFNAIVAGLQSGNKHPKMLKLSDIVSHEMGHGRKVLVLCTTRAGADEISSMLIQQIKPVITLHGGIRKSKLEEYNRTFDEATSGIAVATATLRTNLGLVVDTVIHYHLLSVNVGYLNSIIPKPRFQTILLSANHRLDLGSKFCHHRQSSQRRRGHKRWTDKEPFLPFHSGLPTP